MDSTDNFSSNVTDVFKELRDLISQLDEKIESISSRLDELSDALLPVEKPEIVEYMKQTIDAIAHLDEINDDIPVSRNELANELKIHPNTAYIRAEKLVQRNKFLKYYGRELGFEKFEEKKAVYYSSFRTLYNHEIVSDLEKKNKSAYMIALTLLQQQPLTKNDFLASNKLVEKELNDGLIYLLNRGFIEKEKTNKKIYYRIRNIKQIHNNE